MTRRLALVATTAVAVIGAAATAAPADAAPAGPTAPPGSLSVSYAVKGSTTVVASALTVTFKPTTIVNTLLADGSLKSSLPLAPVKVSYLAYGFLPATATVVFTQVGLAGGALTPTDSGLVVSATAKYVVTLRDVSFGGTDAKVGSNCQTIQPVTVAVATPAHQSFDIGNGGTLAGTYTIGQFANCGNALHLVNDLVPGRGNTISLALSHGAINPTTTAGTA